ncbi:hypothetical protein EJ110_NYTH31358, partial [Nymphaea thermarum]
STLHRDHCCFLFLFVFLHSIRAVKFRCYCFVIFLFVLEEISPDTVHRHCSSTGSFLCRRTYSTHRPMPPTPCLPSPCVCHCFSTAMRFRCSPPCIFRRPLVESCSLPSPVAPYSRRSSATALFIACARRSTPDAWIRCWCSRPTPDVRRLDLSPVPDERRSLPLGTLPDARCTLPPFDSGDSRSGVPLSSDLLLLAASCHRYQPSSPFYCLSYLTLPAVLLRLFPAIVALLVALFFIMAAPSSSSTVNQTEIGVVRPENVPMQVITLRLTKENYFSWSPAMTMGIAGHGRMDYIDGSNPEPARTSGVWHTWFLEDNQVKTWIVNFVSTEIQPLILRKKTARDMWVVLEQMYGQKKTAIPTYQIMKTVYGLRQGNSSVADYYGALKAKWEELDYHSDIPWHCPQDEALHVAQEWENMLFLFLAGLNDEFESVRSQILNSEEVSSIEDVYSCVEAEEQRRLVTNEGKRDLVPSHDRSALVSREKKGNRGRSSIGKTPVSGVSKSSGEKLSISADQIRELRAYLGRIDVNQVETSKETKANHALAVIGDKVPTLISLTAATAAADAATFAAEAATVAAAAAATVAAAAATAAAAAAAAVPNTTVTVSAAARVTLCDVAPALSPSQSLLRIQSCVVDHRYWLCLLRRRLASRRRRKICVLRRFLGLPPPINVTS